MASQVREAPAEQVVELPEPWRSAAVTVVLPTYNEAANLPVNGAPSVPGHLVSARLTIFWDVYGSPGPARFGPGSAVIGYRTQSVVRVIRCWISRPRAAAEG